MKISFGLLPDHPMNEILDTIEVADRLGFHGVYGADETFHKELLPDLRRRRGAGRRTSSSRPTSPT